MSITFVPGPPTARVSHEQAKSEVKAHLPEGTDFEIIDKDGRWVAAYVAPAVTSDWRKSDFPPADSDEESPGPKSEGPDDTAPEPSDDEGGGEFPGEKKDDGEGGPPKDKEGEKGDAHILHKLMGDLQMIMQALGIEPPAGGEESPVPGQEGMPPPPGPPGPPGGAPGGAPHPPHPGGPGAPPGGPDQLVQHQRALKPGEAPPGSTPVGAPAFASVAVDESHPWYHLIGKKASFTVTSDPIEDTSTIHPLWGELERVAFGTGYHVSQITTEVQSNGQRVAKALIQAH